MVTPYLCFSGNCEEALDFYEEVLNGKDKKILRYGDFTPPSATPMKDDVKALILHAEMEICGQKFWFANELEQVSQGNIISLVLSYPSKEEVKQVYEYLKEEGMVLLEPTPQHYSDMHAIVRDRFGIQWNILCEKKN